MHTLAALGTAGLTKAHTAHGHTGSVLWRNPGAMGKDSPHLYPWIGTTHGDKHQSQLTLSQQQLLSARTAGYCNSQKLP